ncbi:hypothetical protein, partial [Holospora obtusa]|uniref:hypothetical protein n=1 Tax=Holospora obtusa TaxID=49893 RepID=UPI0019552956
LSNSRYKYQEDPVSFFVLKNLQTKNMIISSKNQLLLRNISYELRRTGFGYKKSFHRCGKQIKKNEIHTKKQ